MVCIPHGKLLGLSVLSGSRNALAPEAIAGLGQVPVVAGGIIPSEGAETLRQAGAAAIQPPSWKTASANGGSRNRLVRADRPASVDVDVVELAVTVLKIEGHSAGRLCRAASELGLGE